MSTDFRFNIEMNDLGMRENIFFFILRSKRFSYLIIFARKSSNANNVQRNPGFGITVAETIVG